jgi:hypothetical protein
MVRVKTMPSKTFVQSAVMSLCASGREKEKGVGTP